MTSVTSQKKNNMNVAPYNYKTLGISSRSQRANGEKNQVISILVCACYNSLYLVNEGIRKATRGSEQAREEERRTVTGFSC